MEMGTSKKQKTTNIFFDEVGSIVEVCTYNTNLKNWLTAYARKYPEECRVVNDDGQGCMTFEIRGRFGFKLTTPVWRRMPESC